MKYDITKLTAPAMPPLGKGTECIKILLSQTSKDMHEPLVPMLFPVLGAHVNGSEFQYPDLSWKELCGQMANLVAESGGNKANFRWVVTTMARPSHRAKCGPSWRSWECPEHKECSVIDRHRRASSDNVRRISAIVVSLHHETGEGVRVMRVVSSPTQVRLKSD